MAPAELWKWAQIKGIGVIGTGDFTYPAWFRELTRMLEPLGNGLFRLRDGFRTQSVPPGCSSDVFFLLSSEISCIFRKVGKTRKVHCLIYVPDFESALRISRRLEKIGNIYSDGRPILGLDAKELLKITLNECSSALFVPAHAWTPHFSVFGGLNGFDTMEECFEELTRHVYAIETGLSSNPSMNRRISALDSITLISNSDAHSPSKLGREANMFDCELSYEAIALAIKTGKGLEGTIEFFPEEGKYYYDGHRSCQVRLSPEESVRNNNLCPVCGRRITMGVLHRIENLADRKKGNEYPEWSPWYKSLAPLVEIIGEALNVRPVSKKAAEVYRKMLNEVGSEFYILMDSPPDKIESAASPIVRKAIEKVRSGGVHIEPGYDGQYGSIRIVTDEDRAESEEP